MLTTNQPAPAIRTTSVSGRPVDLAALRGKTVLVKFHRFSGCPVARRQIDELIEQQDALNAADVETIVFLHSSPAKTRANFHEVPGLHLVADRQKAFYREYRSRFLWRKLLAPASWRATFSAFAKGYFPQFNRFEGGIVAVPSDFLVDRTGRIVDLHYGRHFGDSWTVAEVLSRVAGLDRAALPPVT